MQTFIWAFGSMVVLLLILTLLPLGYTLKGKFLVGLASFVLSLGGLAAAATFPLWQTALMLFGLIFFTSYFMNNRIGSLLIKENPLYEEVLIQELDLQKEEKTKEVNLLQIEEEVSLPNSSYFNFEKDSVSLLSPSPLSDIQEKTDSETDQENDYLSDIESLLEFESEKIQDHLLEEKNQLSSIILEKKATEKNGDVEEPLDNSLFDFLLAKKEVAADLDVIQEIIEEKE